MFIFFVYDHINFAISLPRYFATSLLRYLAISLPRYFATSLPRYLQRPRSGKSKGVFYHHRINLHPFLELLEAFEHDL